MIKAKAQVYKIHLEKTKEGETRVGVKPVLARFELPDILFGSDLDKKAAIVKDIWDKDGKILGACSIGQKGSGKSTLVELISNNCIDAGYPVLLVDEPFSKQIVEEATRILGDCVFLGDEFEKIFSRGIADELLTFFSDRTLGKVLFLITANDIRGLSQFMIHRPGRFLFKFEFEGCEEKVVRQICDHYKVVPEITEFIVKHSAAVVESIDSVIALAKNSIGYTNTKDFKELFEYLNVKKPSFKNYRLSIQGMEEAEGIDTRFSCFLTDGKWSVTDSSTGMTYDKNNFHKRGDTWTMFQSISGSHVRFELTYTEFNEPQEMQTDIPISMQNVPKRM